MHPSPSIRPVRYAIEAESRFRFTARSIAPEKEWPGQDSGCSLCAARLLQPEGQFLSRASTAQDRSKGGWSPSINVTPDTPGQPRRSENALCEGAMPGTPRSARIAAPRGVPPTVAGDRLGAKRNTRAVTYISRPGGSALGFAALFGRARGFHVRGPTTRRSRPDPRGRAR